MSRRTAPLAIVLIALMTACGEMELPTAPALHRSQTLLDAANGGGPGFYFLPPLVKQPTYNGTFDPSASPTVQVCADVSCAVMHAVFTMTSGAGSEVVRVDGAKEQYIVNWHSGKTGAVAGQTYRVRVLLGGAVMGFADVTMAGKGGGGKNSGTNGSIVLNNGSTLPIKFRIETDRGPQVAPSCRSCLEVVPSAVLLSRLGAQQQLTAFLVDAGGVRTPVTATFESSKPEIVGVSSAGLATATADLGSSQIVARAGNETSAPVLALVAEPVAGALLISDSQIDGGVSAVDAAAPYQPGWQYHVRLRGVSPQVGQVVINTGGAAIQGRVISVTPLGSGIVDVVLELLPLSGMFVNISINEHLPLASTPFTSDQLSSQGFALEQGSGGTLGFSRKTQRMTPTNLHSVQRAAGAPLNAIGGEAEFNLGAFECKAEGGAGVNFPLSLDAATFALNPGLAIDLVVEGFVVPRVKSLMVTGTLAPTISLNPHVDGAVEGEVECRAESPVALPLPFAGFLATIVGGQVVFGVGFGIEGKSEVGGIGFDSFLQSTIIASFGVDCTPSCRPVSQITANSGGFFKPTLPSLDLLRIELGVSAFAFATLQIESPLVEEPFDLLDVKGGLEQTAALAGMKAQVLDEGYASGFELAPTFEAKIGDDLEYVAGLLTISLGSLSFSPDLTPLAQSPTGTLTIEPAEVEPGNDEAPGELAKFKVTINNPNYFSIYAIDGIEIRWLRKDDNGDPILEPGRPGCTTKGVDDPGQTVFECEAFFLDEHEGDQTFYAFVNAKLFGVSVPIPLEIGENSAATVTVGNPYGHVNRHVQFHDGRVQDIDVTTSNPLSPAGLSYVGQGVISYHATNVVTHTDGCLANVTLNGSGTQITVTNIGGTRPWLLNILVSGTSSSVRQCDGGTTSGPFNNLSLQGPLGVAFTNGSTSGIDFTQSFTNASATVIVTGKLKVTVP